MVQRIPESAIASHSKVHNNINFPNAIDWYCPFCGKSISFSLSWSVPSLSKMPPALFTKSRCPRCSEIATFLYVGLDYPLDKDSFAELYIYPRSKAREPLEGISKSEKFSNGLRKAYESTINVYNVREWESTAVNCRRLLEGIAMHLLPEDAYKKPILAQMIEKIPEHVDFNAPILTIADGIRLVGNIGAHFDIDRSPDETISTLMMDMLDFLIEYIFLLPDKVKELHDNIESLKANE